MNRQEIIFFAIEVTILTSLFLIGRFFLDVLNSSSIQSKDSLEHDSNILQTMPMRNQTSDSAAGTITQEELEQADEFLENLATGLLNTAGSENTHNSADALQFKELCEVYHLICKKTLRDGTYSSSHRINYQGLLIYIVKQLDSRIRYGDTLEHTITTLGLSTRFPEKRGSAGHTHARFNTSKIDSRNEFFQVAVHEISHIIDLGIITGKSVFKDNKFTEFGEARWATNDPSLDFYSISWINENTRKQGLGPEHFVSGYSMKNIYEDFAESMTFYLLYHDLFQQKAQENTILMRKYQYMDSIFDGQYLQSGNSFKGNYSTKKTYWDITRLFEDLR